MFLNHVGDIKKVESAPVPAKSQKVAPQVQAPVQVAAPVQKQVPVVAKVPKPIEPPAMNSVATKKTEVKIPQASFSVPKIDVPDLSGKISVSKFF